MLPNLGAQPRGLASLDVILRAERNGEDSSAAAPSWPAGAKRNVDGPHPSTAIECCSELVEPLDSPVVPVGELVPWVPAHRREPSPHEDAELVNQVLVSSRIVRCNFFGDVGDVVLDGPALACVEVDEERPSAGA